MNAVNVPWPSRLWLALACPFRILFDARYAAGVARVGSGSEAPALEAPETTAPAPAPAAPSGAEALQLLSIFQREGRLVDFLEQDITTFGDADVGAAARVVHEGCRRALHAHARVESVRNEAEGARLTLERADSSVKLVGNVGGAAPYRGVLRHRGWRVQDLKLPTRVGEHDPRLVAPAELELP